MSAFSLHISGVASTLARLRTTERRIVWALNRGVARQAMALKKEIQTGLRNQSPGGFPIQPLAPMTLALRRLPTAGSKGAASGRLRRGSSKALIDSGEMIRSVNVDKLHEMAYFVGINRTARTADGGDLADLAELHEFGGPPFVIVVTPKVRAFFFALFKMGLLSGPLSRHKKRISHPGVPARPFLTPAFDKWKKDAGKEFAQDLGKMLGF